MIKFSLKEKRKSQVWVETVIYTLIGLTIIAIVLSIAIPQIEKARERAVIRQTIDALNKLNEEIQKVEQTVGTRKIVDFRISKGKIEINGENNTISYILENTKLEFSERGQIIKKGDLFYLTQEYGRRFNIIIELDYGDPDPSDGNNNPKLDIQNNGESDKKRTLHAPALYRIQIENIGDGLDTPTKIDFIIG